MIARALEFVVPGDLRTATGGYHYDRRIIAGLRELGWSVTVHALDASFPFPTSSAIEQARAAFAGIREGALVLVDGLAFGAMPLVVAEHASRLKFVALIHHPLAAESGLVAAVAQDLECSERRALSSARHVVVTSDATREALRAYDVAPKRVSVVEPGTEEARFAVGAREHRAPKNAVSLLCVASVTPRKGHALLIEALSSLASLPWHLTSVGPTARSPSTMSELRDQIARAGLVDRVTFVGEMDDHEVASFYQTAELFVLPTLYEGYGMAVAEAIAHGLPVISTRTGAIPELVGESAGLLVPPGDVRALSEALARVLREPELLAALTEGAAAGRSTLPRWPEVCERMSRVLEQAGEL